ncbi:MAG: hypothetical protein MJK04_28060, partial [Psychrosphaera sp.]|nr:hypothetical protein [Psychrosphaera sp.]
MQSLLIADGLDTKAYQHRFGSDCLTDFSQLDCLLEGGFAKLCNERICLTSAGMERADSIGPWFTSTKVNQAMAGYELK